MARLAFGLPVELDEAFAEQAQRHGHEVLARMSSAHELAAHVDAARPDAVIVSAQPRYLTPRLLATADESGVRLIAAVGSDADRRYAATLGLFELIPADAPWEAVEELLGGVRPLEAAVAAAESPGTVVAVWGPVGAPGRTTVAVNLAAELAAAGRSVILADADTHGAAVGPVLGMLDEAPGFAAACRLAGSDSLSRSEFERVAHRYESGHGGFWVLTGIGRPSRWPELSAERVTKAIRQLRGWADFVVLDVAAGLERDEELVSDLHAPRRNAATIAAVQAADHVLAVGSADPVGVARLLRSHVEVVEAAPSARVTVVMNRLRASAIGLNPQAQVSQTLSRFGGIDDPVIVPHDLAAADAAVLSGRTLADAAPRSAARQAIARIASERLGVQPANSPGWFGRARTRR